MQIFLIKILGTFFIIALMLSFVFLKNRLIQFAIVLLLTYIFIYFHPTQEFLTCDLNYHCQIKQTYFKIYDIEKSFYLSKNSIIEGEIYTIPFYFRNLDRKYYLKIKFLDSNNIVQRPFVYYIEIFEDDFSAQQNILNIQKSFNNYLNKPSQNFYIKSKADILYVLPLALFILMIIICCFYKDIE